MKRHIWTMLAIIASATVFAPVLTVPASAAAPVLPVRMQAVGTFSAGQPAAKITMTAAADESEPASFVAQSSKLMSGVTLKLAGDLVCGKSKIPSSSAIMFTVDGDSLSPATAFNLQPGVSKRFWLTVNVPLRTASGTYKGAVFAVAGGKPVGKLPIELNILPLRLLQSSKQFGVVFRQCTPVSQSYKSLLAGLKASGLFMVSSAAPADVAAEELNAIKTAGFSASVLYVGPLASAADVASLQAQAKAAGIRRVFYSIGVEPTTVEDIEAAKLQIETLERERALCFATINDAGAFDRLSVSLNGMACRADTPYAQGLLAGQKRTANRYEWWYWDVFGSPKDNRLHAGWLLWKARLDGAVAVLPSPDDGESFVRTRQWEAFREGMDDTRYATTLMAASREVKDALKVGGTKNGTFARKASDDTDAYLAAAFAKPLNALSDSDYQAMRLKMARLTIELRKHLK